MPIKGYLSTFVFGIGTDTLDAEGVETARADASLVDTESLDKAMASLRGPNLANTAHVFCAQARWSAAIQARARRH